MCYPVISFLITTFVSLILNVLPALILLLGTRPVCFTLLWPLYCFQAFLAQHMWTKLFSFNCLCPLSFECHRVLSHALSVRIYLSPLTVWKQFKDSDFFSFSFNSQCLSPVMAYDRPFVCFYFLRQGLILSQAGFKLTVEPSLALNLLCSHGWPYTPVPPAFTSQVLAFDSCSDHGKHSVKSVHYSNIKYLQLPRIG